MPELPEVETIVRGLANAVAGKAIVSAHVSLPRIVRGTDARSLERKVAGERIASVSRRAKWIVIALGSGSTLLVHLRMTGRMIVQPPGTPEPEPYTNAFFMLDDGTRLCFADVRTLGTLELIPAGDAWDGEIGLEPLSDAFTPEYLRGLVKGRATSIKSLLLDQRRIAGIGNIYACESLWSARIRPTRRAGSLSGAEVGRLHGAIRAVLHEAIHMRGTSVDDYVDAEGLRGGFQNVLQVYGRAGAPCSRCGEPLLRTVIAGRGTWWCRTCQRR